MKAPWILVWALASVPVFAQDSFPNNDRSAAFDVILEFVDGNRADELRASREAVDAARDELVSLRDAVESDEDAIASARENLASLRRELRDEIRVEIDANEDLQAELRSVAQDAREDRVEAVADRRDETFDAVLSAATDEQAPILVENRDAIVGLVDELRSLREGGATRDDLADQREQLRTLQRDQRELVSDIVDANDDLLADSREVRHDIRRDVRDSNDRFRRDRRPGIEPAMDPRKYAERSSMRRGTS